MAEKTELPDDFCDVLVCNSVLHNPGQNIEHVKQSLREFFRITKTGGSIFIGEMPDSNEMAGKKFGDSIASWLYWVLKTQGFTSFLARLKQCIVAVFSKEPFVISPKTMFYMPPHDFIRLLKEFKIEVKEFYKHIEIDNSGNEFESKTRWNYLCVKN